MPLAIRLNHFQNVKLQNVEQCLLHSNLELVCSGLENQSQSRRSLVITAAKSCSSHYTPGIYADGYTVFAFPFVRSYVRWFVRWFVGSFVRSLVRSLFRNVRGIYVKVFVKVSLVVYFS